MRHWTLSSAPGPSTGGERLHVPLDIALGQRLRALELPSRHLLGEPVENVLAARFAAQMLLRALNAIGISDGELAGLPDRAATALQSLFENATGR